MESQLACVLRITDVGTRMTNCDVINIRNTIITSEGTILLHLLESGIREIKRSPDTMKAAAILVSMLNNYGHGPRDEYYGAKCSQWPHFHELSAQRKNALLHLLTHEPYP